MRRVWLMIRISGRRPASWLSLGAAAVAVWFLGAVPMALSAPVMASWIGACLAVAAIGALPPCSLVPVGGRHQWLACRLAWPAAGVMVLALVRVIASVVTAGPASLALTGIEGVLAMLAGLAAVGCVGGAVLGWGGRAADAASLGLLLVEGATLAGWLATRGQPHSPWLMLTVTVAAWAGLAVACIASNRLGEDPLIPLGSLGRGGGGILSERLPQGPLRMHVTRGGMIAGLVGMVAWLFLTPADAAIDLWMTMGCFVALAVPPALLPFGSGDSDWQRICRSAASVDALRTWRPRTNADWFAAAAAPLYGVLLGWPPLVAGLLFAGEPERAADALLIVVAVALATGVLWLAAHAVAAGFNGETALACAMVAAIAAGLAAVSLPPARLMTAQPAGLLPAVAAPQSPQVAGDSGS